MLSLWFALGVDVVVAFVVVIVCLKVLFWLLCLRCHLLSFFVCCSGSLFLCVRVVRFFIWRQMWFVFWGLLLRVLFCLFVFVVDVVFCCCACGAYVFLFCCCIVAC